MQTYDDRLTFLLPRPTWVNDVDVSCCHSCFNAFGPLRRRVMTYSQLKHKYSIFLSLQIASLQELVMSKNKRYKHAHCIFLAETYFVKTALLEVCLCRS